MKKSVLITLVVFALIFKTYGQGIEVPCGFRIDEKEYLSLKDPNSKYNKRLNFIKNIPKGDLKRLKKIEFKNNQFDAILGAAEEVWCIPIAAHILRRTNGSGGLSNADLNVAIQNLNNNFRGFNMTFQVCEIRFIDDDELFNFEFDDSVEQNADRSSTRLNVTQRNVNRVVNIYFVPKSTTSWAWRPNTNESKQHIIANNRQVIEGPTLTHEVGHWFGLIHTHGNSNTCVNYITDELRWFGFAGQIAKRVFVDFQGFLRLSFFQNFQAIRNLKRSAVVFDCSTPQCIQRFLTVPDLGFRTVRPAPILL